MTLFSNYLNRLTKKQPKLIMTILARNEGDIIQQNIEFHLSRGVDFIIATDNASIDNTRNIFSRYQKKGKLLLIDEPGRNHSQAVWNNRMAKIAVDHYGADMIFHCDADEFWSPKSGNLKNEIGSVSVELLTVNVVNILIENMNGKEIFPRDLKYAVIQPIETRNFREDSKKKNLYYFRYPPKVMMKTNSGVPEVTHGNHAVINLGEHITGKVSSDIEIYHFPLRGKKHFYKKVIEAGKAIEKNHLLSKNECWHIRRWYEAYNSGCLDRMYKKLTITKEEAEKLRNRGVVEEFDFNSFITAVPSEKILY